MEEVEEEYDERETICAAQKEGILVKDLMHMLLLDNGSSCTLINNKDMVINIRKSNKVLRLITNGGVVTVRMKATLKGFLGEVWFEPKAAVNVIGFSEAKDKGYVMGYQNNKDLFTMTNPSTGVVSTFKRYGGIYAIDTRSKLSEKGICCVSTVEDRKKMFSKVQQQKAEQAKVLHESLCYPTIADFKHILRMHMIEGCPVKSSDVDLMLKIYGKDVLSLKGKATKKKGHRIVENVVKIPKAMKKAHQGIVLSVDIMYVNGETFLVSKARNIGYLHAVYLPKREKPYLRAALDEHFVLYNKNGYTIKQVNADGEFEFVKQDMEHPQVGIKVNIVTKSEHVAEIERMIRTIKERVRCMWNSMPYSRIPKLMLIGMVKNAVKWLNTFPIKNGVSDTYSPRTIIEGKTISYEKHCKIPFGSFVQAYEDNGEQTNTTQERTIDCILLDAREHGGYDLLHLRAGLAVSRPYVWTAVPDAAVVKRVEALAAKDGMPEVQEPILGMYVRTTGVYQQYQRITAGVKPTKRCKKGHQKDGKGRTLVEIPEHASNTTDQDDDDDDSDMDVDEEDSDDDASEPSSPEDLEDDDHSTSGLDDSPKDSTDHQKSQKQKQTLGKSQGVSLEPTKPRRSSRIAKQQECSEHHYMQVHLDHWEQETSEHCHFATQALGENAFEYEYDEAEQFGCLLHQMLQKGYTDEQLCCVQQYTLKKGIEKFGEKGQKSADDEMAQLHNRGTFRPLDVRLISPLDKKRAMEALIFMVEKRDGRIKSRTCANGSKQRAWMQKDEASSPAVRTESLMLSCVIDAKEGRHVGTTDIPNAFIQTDNEKLADDHGMDIIKIRGILVEMLVEIAPNTYGPWVTYERGEPVLYLELLKAIYGMLKSALLFYRKLRKDMESNGFKRNPYDICVFNKVVDGDQLTVMAHVDDCKYSSVNDKAMDAFEKWLQQMYSQEEITPMKFNRGDVHDYLGMVLDYSKPGKVMIHMKDYVERIVTEFPYLEEVEKMKPAQTPAGEHLFMTMDNGEKVSPDKAKEFHTTVAKTLFVCKRSRPDLQPTVPFLCSRVKSPDVHDWKKLLRLLKCMQSTKDMVLTLEASGKDGVIVCKWFPDAAFAVHPDFKSHTGGVLTLGKGAVNTLSQKQKLNTTSSTEAELVGAHDVLPQALWTRYFLEEQGYTCDTVVYQDNTSAIQLEQNGTESSSKRTRHINVRFFFMKDCVDRRLLKVEYCPTEDMLGDFPSKPLQGSLFKKHRKALMNL